MLLEAGRLKGCGQFQLRDLRDSIEIISVQNVTVNNAGVSESELKLSLLNSLFTCFHESYHQKAKGGRHAYNTYLYSNTHIACSQSVDYYSVQNSGGGQEVKSRLMNGESLYCTS